MICRICSQKKARDYNDKAYFTIDKLRKYSDRLQRQYYSLLESGRSRNDSYLKHIEKAPENIEDAIKKLKDCYIEGKEASINNEIKKINSKRNKLIDKYNRNIEKNARSKWSLLGALAASGVTAAALPFIYRQSKSKDKGKSEKN